MTQIFDKLQHFPDCTCVNSIDHPSHAKPGIHPFDDRLYVCTILFNPLRFRSRYANYWTFANHIQKAGGVLYTTEIAMGDRHFEITDHNNPHHLQFRAKDSQEIWLKECGLNLLIQRLPPEAKYIAIIDADVQFARPDICQETLHLLQHYSWVQMFSHATDLGPDYQHISTIPGFFYSRLEEAKDEITYNKNNKKQNFVILTENSNQSLKDKLLKAIGLGQIKDTKCIEKCIEELDICMDDCQYYGVEKIKGKEKGWQYSHPGFAHAFRRDVLDKVGGLVDWTILGSGDFVMSKALFGEVEDTLNVPYSDNYKFLCREWQNRAEKYIRRNVGFVPGTVFHSWHGQKSNRNYDRRWTLLCDTKFDPLTDLKRDSSGLYQLEDHGDMRSIKLRDGLRHYAKLRDEDNQNVG